jgi:hypothetical protein
MYVTDLFFKLFCNLSDASKETEKVLRSLGAQVETGGIRMGLTHMIWSNGNIKMVKAAEFMDIIVVSPLWVEQCRESAKLVPVEDFIVLPDDAMRLSAPPAIKEMPVAALPVPVAHAADEFDEPGKFSSSQRILAKSVDAKGNKVDKKKKGAPKIGVIKSVSSKKNDSKADKSTNNTSATDRRSSRSGQEKRNDHSLAALSPTLRTELKSSSGGEHSLRGGKRQTAKSLSPAVQEQEDMGGTEKQRSARKRKTTALLSSSADYSLYPKVTEEDEAPLKVTKMAPKRRRLSSKIAVDSDDDIESNGQSNPIDGHQRTKQPKTGTEEGKSADDGVSLSLLSKEKKSTGKKVVALEIATKKKAVAEKKTAEKKVTEKKTRVEKKKVLVEMKSSAPKGNQNVTSSSTSSSSLSSSVSQDTTHAILSVSGFSSDERSLLEDIIESLVSQQHQSKGKGQSKSKSKSGTGGEGGGVRRVSLQQSDPRMELQLVKALTSATHVISPEHTATATASSK